MSDELPSMENLAVCTDHGIMMHAKDADRRCPLCHLDVDVDVRRDAEIPGGSIKQQEIRQRIDAETMEELLPLMDEYLEDTSDDGYDLWVAVSGLDGTLPAGYSEAQERWVNVVVYRFGAMKKCITLEQNARETIETLRGNGYGADAGSEAS